MKKQKPSKKEGFCSFGSYPKNSRSKAASADFSHGFSEYLPGELECGEHPSGVFAQWSELEDVAFSRDVEEFIRSEEKR